MNKYIEQLFRVLNHPYAKVAAGVGIAIVGGVTLYKSFTNKSPAPDNKPEN